MGILTKAMCKMGRHSGDWSAPGRRCEAVRICDSCGKRKEDVRHSWGQYSYVNDDQCEQLRRCDRCGSTESQSRHEWGPWVYLDEELGTAQVHTCRRCHKTARTSRFSAL